MAEVGIVGDVLTFDGYDIARVSKRVPASVRDRFEQALEKAWLDETVKVEEDKPEANPLDDVLAKIKETAQAGMIEVSDVERVFAELKDNDE